eukprot:2559203-Ditylum_brightwellii.AAC.1
MGGWEVGPGQGRASDGVVVSVGGQIPNCIAIPPDKVREKTLAMLDTMMDNAKDCQQFYDMIDKIGVQ